MKKKTFITLSFACFSLFGMAQTAVTISKTPASEPAKNDTIALSDQGTQKVVSVSKNANTSAAPEQQSTTPSATEEKTTNGRKKPE